MLTAVLGAILAAVLIAGSVSVVRMSAGRLWLLEPGQSLWRVPLIR